MNLLDETIRAIGRAGFSVADVAWVGSDDGRYAIDWQTFAGMADFNYDSGWGTEKVARDLVVVLPGCWLSRWEYDGSEGWQIHKKPERKADAKKFTSVENAGGCPWIEDIEEDMEEQRNNPTGWNAIFHSQPITNSRGTA